MGREGLRNIGEIFVIGFAINRTEMKQSLRETVKRFFFFLRWDKLQHTWKGSRIERKSDGTES